MRLFRNALVLVLIVIFGVAVYQSMLWLGVWGDLNESQVMALEDGDQEVAFLEPATSTDEWSRLVTALDQLAASWTKINPNLPELRISGSDAFPALTADVPEIVLSRTDAPKQKLRLRWYKISGEHDAVSWISKLQARKRQPLAIIGGSTSDRAAKIAYTMKKYFGDDPTQASPIFLLTTATSEKTAKLKSLINVYNRRSFRFSFTNQKMVESLLAFVQHRQYPEADREWAQNLWVNKQPEPQANAISATMHAVTWEDDRYSQDMNSLFEIEFKKKENFPKGEFIHEPTIPYSVGGFFHPAPQEQVVVGTFLARPMPVTPHSFLVLPTSTVRMRRFLINLRQRSPLDARNLVVLNGDAISFHTVYRDREVMWNILDLPYSLVFFSHRNPIDHAAGFTWTKDEAHPERTTTGTHDILLYRDLFESLLYAVYDQRKLLSDPLLVRDRLQKTVWVQPPPDREKQDSPRVRNPLVHTLKTPMPFFDADGNRQSHTGEHIVWVKPNFTEDRVDLISKISIWARHPDKNSEIWQLVEAANATYNQSRMEEAP